MKITTKKTKTGASISIRATSAADKQALTKAVMDGSLMRALNGTQSPAALRESEESTLP